jgi:hypothetical protein
LIVRPSQITGVHIQGSNFNQNNSKNKINKNVNEVIPQIELDDLPDIEDMISKDPEEMIDPIEEDMSVIDSIEDISESTVEDEVDAWHSEIENE